MAVYRQATFGSTVCRIYVNKHVDPLARHIPSVAIAFAGNDEVIENDKPVERVGNTDDDAVAAMWSYLEKRFGPQVGDVAYG